MNVKAVKYFLAVCEKRNFTKAATALGIAQPSLSTAIQRLEREIGGPLFYRNAHDVGLTELGRNLRPIFRAIVRYADRAASKARAMWPICRTMAQKKSIGILAPRDRLLGKLYAQAVKRACELNGPEGEGQASTCPGVF